MPRRQTPSSSSSSSSPAKRPRRAVNDAYPHPVSCGSVRQAGSTPGPESSRERNASNWTRNCTKNAKNAKNATNDTKNTMNRGARGANAAAAASKGPYPSRARPTPGDAYRAVDELASLHGEYEHGESGTVLDALVRTMLSQNTTDVTSAVSAIMNGEECQDITSYIYMHWSRF